MDIPFITKMRKRIGEFNTRSPYHKDDIRHPRHTQPIKKVGGSARDIKKMALAAEKRQRKRVRNMNLQ